MPANLISAAEAQRLMLEQDAVLVDVREQDEWDAGHVQGATHAPLATVPERLDELRSKSSLIIVCRSGGRSARAAAWLSSQGIEASDLDGGMKAWQQAGLQLVSSEGQPGKVI